MNYAIFLIVYGIQIAVTLPRFWRTCTDPTPFALLLYFLHHVGDVFLFWGPLFLRTPAEYGAHIAYALIVMVHWFLYGNRCFLTVVMNRRCGYDEDYWLDSLKNRFGFREAWPLFQFVWAGLLVAYGVRKLAFG